MKKVFSVSVVFCILLFLMQGFSPIVFSQNHKSLEIIEGEDIEYWAVCVGIADYEGRENDLPVSKQHLRCFPDALLLADNWDEDHILLLLNEQATQENILSAFDWLSNQSDADDIVVFSFQGHGFVAEDTDMDEKDGYDEAIVAWEGKSGLIIDDVLDQKLDAINCSGMFLVFHSCLSGGLIDDTMIEYRQAKHRFGSELMTDVDDTNRIVFMSSMDGGLALAFPSITRQLGWKISSIFDSESNIPGDVISVEQITAAAKQRVYQIIVGFFLIYPPFIISFALAEVIARVLHGFWILPFPQVHDGYDGEMPLLEL